MLLVKSFEKDKNVKYKKFFRATIGVLVILILTYMADPVWGMLAKSQIDPETIEEAITRIVGEHNDATDAHVGGNRSLESHRTNDVLDHLPGSVYADKGSFWEVIIESSFEDISHWTIGGDVTIQDFPGVQLYIESGAVEHSEMSSVSPFPGGFFNTDYGLMFNATAFFTTGNNDFDAFLGFGETGGTPGDCFGFRIVAGALYPHLHLAGTDVDGATIGIDLNDAHVYQAQYDAVSRQVDFYIDGELVDSLIMPAGNPNVDGGAKFNIDTNGTVDGSMKVMKVRYARGLVLP